LNRSTGYRRKLQWNQNTRWRIPHQLTVCGGHPLSLGDVTADELSGDVIRGTSLGNDEKLLPGNLWPVLTR